MDIPPQRIFEQLLARARVTALRRLADVTCMTLPGFNPRSRGLMDPLGLVGCCLAPHFQPGSTLQIADASRAPRDGDLVIVTLVSENVAGGQPTRATKLLFRDGSTWKLWSYEGEHVSSFCCERYHGAPRRGRLGGDHAHCCASSGAVRADPPRSDARASRTRQTETTSMRTTTPRSSSAFARPVARSVWTDWTRGQPRLF